MLCPFGGDFSAVLILPQLHTLPNAVLVRHLILNIGELPQQESQCLLGSGEVRYLSPGAPFVAVVQLALVLPLEIQFRQSHSGIVIKKIDV